MVSEMAAKINREFWKVNSSNCEVDVKLSGVSNHWHSPSSGFLKINVDGAFSPLSKEATIGMICRDESGWFKWGFVDKIKSLSAFMTEALALKRALLIAIDLGLNKVIFESDSLFFIQSVQSKRPDLHDWRSRGMVQDIIKLLASNVGFTVYYVPRKCNAAADCIAAESYKRVYPSGWVSKPSPSLIAILTEDARRLITSGPANDSNPRRGVG